MRNILVITFVLLIRYTQFYSQNHDLVIYYVEVPFDGGHKMYYGFISQNGDTICKPIYEEAYKIYDTEYIKIRLNSRVGLVNQRGEIVIPADYQDIETVSEGIVLIHNNGKWGYVDLNNVQIIPCQYIGASKFIDGKAVVIMEDNRTIVINTKNEVLSEINEILNYAITNQSDVISYLSSEDFQSAYENMPQINTKRSIHSGFEWIRRYRFDHNITFWTKYDNVFEHTTRIPAINMYQALYYVMNKHKYEGYFKSVGAEKLEVVFEWSYVIILKKDSYIEIIEIEQDP